MLISFLSVFINVSKKRTYVKEKIFHYNFKRFTLHWVTTFNKGTTYVNDVKNDYKEDMYAHFILQAATPHSVLQ